jgi:hypothetical protein
VRLTSDSAMRLLVLLAASFALLAALGAEERGLCFQSPSSPVQPVAPGGLPVAPRAAAPSVRSVAGSSRLLSQSFWASPLPWVAVGAVLFASISWALITLISWLEPPQQRGASDTAIEATLSPQEGTARDNGPSGQA